MGRNDFALNIEAGSAFQDIAPPQLAHIPLDGGPAIVAPGEKLLIGAAVGTPRVPLGPWAHASIAGEVVAVCADSVTIRATEGQKPHDEPKDFTTLNGKALLEALSHCGIDASVLHPARHLIVNASPPEPAITVTGRLLRDYRDTLSRGLKLARTVVCPTNVTVAGPDVDASAFGNCEVVRLPARYPYGLDPLVIKAVTGNESPAGVTVVNLLQLLALGRVQETGRPLTDVFLTVQDRNVRARVGTPLHELFNATGIRFSEADRAILGGPMRGTALYGLNTGLKRSDYGLFRIPQGSYPPVHDAACLNCGECVRHCPARIFPGELSMCAEGGLWERARLGYVEICFECGICGYVCPARRPLLQYLQLAKAELRLLDAAQARAKTPEETASTKDDEGAE